MAEFPYDFNRRLLSVVAGRPGESPLLITKGAPEAVIARASQVREDHTARPIDSAEHARLAALVDGASAEGYRIVAVGSRVLAPDELAGRESAVAGPEAAARLERDLVFEGVILFSDPAKAGVGKTISQLAGQHVALKIVTGDNELVARHVAAEVGLAIEGVLTGEEMRTLSHPALVARAARTTLFARVDPDQKLRVIRALRESGAVVGYLGDGINDAPALHVADVGISVDNATDVARSAADIILLEPSLEAISQGVTEGRRTFANTLKYIRMGTSSNFGNMLSMAGAALLLPFLPMTPAQILLNNLIYDASQTAIPTDTIDPDVAAEPASWDIRGIERFMVALRAHLVGLRLPDVRPAAAGAGGQRDGVPHRLVHRVAVHADPGRAGHPDATEPVLAEPAEPGARGGDRRRARGGGRASHSARWGPCWALPRSRQCSGCCSRYRGGVPGPRRDRQALVRGAPPA